MAYVILVRHGKSEWNALGLWTGWTDVSLAPEGIEEARRTGDALRTFAIHEVHTSELKRAQQTFEEIKNIIGCHASPVYAHTALNERHYGVHTGKNKWQIKDEVGEEIFHNIRRGWDYPIPEGETLKDVYDRAVAYYKAKIEPAVKEGKNVMIVAHGNSLRALIKYIENISEADIANVELNTAEAHCYQFDEQGRCIGKEIRSQNSDIV